MKDSIKMMFGFFIGALIFGGIGGYAASVLTAKEVTYTATNQKFKAGNVSDAIDALYVLGLNSMDATPIGVLAAYMGTQVPTNYLLCDGTVYNIEDYQELADHIKNNFGSYNKFGGNGETTFAVPDLRGEFLRGAGTNSHADQGNGSAVGTHQNATKTPYIISGSGRLSIQASTTIVNPDVTLGNVKLKYTTVSSDTTNSYPNYYTSRPTNTSVNFIIKAK